MTVYKSIVAAPHDAIDWQPGFNGVALDDETTLVWCSDHDRADPPRSASALGGFVSGFETLDSHPEAASAGGGLETSSDHPQVDAGPPSSDQATWDGVEQVVRSIDARNGDVVVWDGFSD